jgi:DNA-binding transcriptional ArsR family regulator
MLLALDRRTAGADELADTLDESVATIRRHLVVLYRAGVLRRVDDGGRPRYELADWPCLWLVEQFAFRLRERALEDAELAGGDDDQPAAS